MVMEFSKFVGSEIGIGVKLPYKNGSIYCVKFGGNILPVKIARVLYERSNIYLDRKHDIYKAWIEEY